MKKKSIIKLIACALAVGLLAALGILLYEPFTKWVQNPQVFRDFIEEKGGWGRMVMVGLMALQVVVAFLPGEPLEIAAGYAFGALEGMALCLAGAAVGFACAALLARTFGRKIVEWFFPSGKIDELPILNPKRHPMLLLFVLYLIPGTPKDLFNYAVGLTRLDILHVLALSSVARIPSVITSTLSGDALGAQNYPLAVAVLVITGLISAGGILLYRRMCRSAAA